MLFTPPLQTRFETARRKMTSTADIDTLTTLLEDDIFKLPYPPIADKLIYSVQTPARVSGHSSDSMLTGYIPSLKSLPFHESLQLCEQLCTSLETLCQWVSLREKYERLWTAEWGKSASPCVMKEDIIPVKDQDYVAKLQEKCLTPKKKVINSVKEVVQGDLQERCKAPIKYRELVAKVQEKCQSSTKDVGHSIKEVMQVDLQERCRVSMKDRELVAPVENKFQTSAKEPSNSVKGLIQVKFPQKEEGRLAHSSQEKCRVQLLNKGEGTLAHSSQGNCRMPFPKDEDIRVVNRKRPAPHEEQICVETPKKIRLVPRNEVGRIAHSSQDSYRVQFPRDADIRVINRKRPASHDVPIFAETPKKKFQFTKIVWDL